MTLAQRILFSILVLVACATLGLAFAVQRAWVMTAEAQFQKSFELATERLQLQLNTDLSEIPAILAPLCAHGQMVDDPLTSLGAGGIPRDRKYALSLLTESTRKAFGFDELTLFTSTGEVLGARSRARIGSREPKLAQLSQEESSSTLQTTQAGPQIVAHCVKAYGKHRVGLQASRNVGSMLERVSALHSISLSLNPQGLPGESQEKLEVPSLGGISVYAAPDREPLAHAVSKLTRTIFLWALGTLLGMLVLGYLFARRLARPLERLAQLAASVEPSETQSIPLSGVRELDTLAGSFNRALGELRKTRKRLAATERIAAQREIARRVAHEIKNPLAPIRAAIETLRRLRRRNDPAFDDYFDEGSATILHEVGRINDIIQSFTNFARLPKPRPQETTLDDVVRHVRTLHQDPPIEWKSPPSPIRLVADKDQLIQVLTNLVQNAVDATAQQPERHIRLSAGETDQSVWLEVADNGKGLAAHVRAQLFRPYITTKSEGTGLGLAIAQQIITEHGGALSYADSELGGACFRLDLPVNGPASSPS